MTLPEIARELGVSENAYSSFRALMDEMKERGDVVQVKRKRYALPEKMGLVVGKLQCNARGFGFVIPLSGGEDVYIARENLGTAMHGDIVVVQLDKPSPKPSARRRRARGPSGKIVDVAGRANDRIVGTLFRSAHFWYIVPDDSRLFKDVYIPKEDLGGAKERQKVVVEITQWPSAHLNPEGRIVEVLGDVADPAVDIITVIREFDLHEEFPSAVVEAARKAPAKVSSRTMSGRHDLTDEPVITIDPEDAADFDDAVSVKRRSDGGWELGVHIADVSHYVHPGSDLDVEARRRGTSVYLPGRVLPMLPETLSSGICSLVQGELRLTKTVRMTFSADGRMTRTRIFPSVIRSLRRLTYNEATDLLEGRAKPGREQIARMLVQMNKLAHLLHERRLQRGSFDLDLPEVEVRANPDGSVKEVVTAQRDASHSLIEEFMLAANEAVARYMTRHRLPYLRRIHPDPSPEDLEECEAFVGALGYPHRNLANPANIRRLLEACRGREDSYAVNMAVLLSMRQAEYSTHPAGHYALAADAYTHFTSPIRRYPDLLLHQVLALHLENKLSTQVKQKFVDELSVLAVHCTERERNAEAAERELTRIKLMRELEGKGREKMQARIWGFSGSAMLVHLKDTLLEGTVRLSSMTDDFYSLGRGGTCMIGKRTKKRFKIGDIVTVRLADLDIAGRQVSFVLTR